MLMLALGDSHFKNVMYAHGIAFVIPPVLFQVALS